MEFIKLEQFKSLDENIQKVFLNWWKPKRYDLYIDSADLSQVECLDYIKEDEEGILYNSMRDNMSFLEDMIPLFSEGMLRRFIEEKAKGVIDLESYYNSKGLNKYEIRIFKFDGITTYKKVTIKNTDLLQGYWELALEIIKEVNR